MVGRFKYKKLKKYPHLRPGEAQLWQLFLDAFPQEFETVDYDVKVGTPRQYPGPADDVFKKDLELLSRKRIDVVAYRGKEIHIIELKHNAGLAAIGQVNGYRKLYAAELKTTESLYATIITDHENPDIRQMANDEGILFFKVPI